MLECSSLQKPDLVYFMHAPCCLAGASQEILHGLTIQAQACWTGPIPLRRLHSGSAAHASSLDSHPMRTESAAASPMGSLSPASSLRSSPGQTQPLTGSQARLPAFARTYDSPAFSPDRRTQLVSARPDDAGHTGGASEVEQWMPRRSAAGSMNLSRLQGGLTNMLGMPVAPSRSPLPSPVSQSPSFPVTTAPAAGGPQMVQNVASPTSVSARNLRLFDSPAYAQSSHGSQASSQCPVLSRWTLCTEYIAGKAQQCREWHAHGQQWSIQGLATRMIGVSCKRSSMYLGLLMSRQTLSPFSPVQCQLSSWVQARSHLRL